jgi:hypothetical protein
MEPKPKPSKVRQAIDIPPLTVEEPKARALGSSAKNENENQCHKPS